MRWARRSTPDPALEAQLRERFAAFGTMPESNLRQALRVPSAEALANPIGSAPGWWVDRDGRVVGADARRAVRDAAHVGRAGGAAAGRPVRRCGRCHVRTVKTFGIGESALAEMVGDLLERARRRREAGIYAHDDGVHLRFWTRGERGGPGCAGGRAAGRAGRGGLGHWTTTTCRGGAGGLGAAGAATVASWEADTGGALLAVLAGAEPVDGAARVRRRRAGRRRSAPARRWPMR